MFGADLRRSSSPTILVQSMLRPLHDGLPTVSQSERLGWYDELPVDGHGQPTNELSSQLLRRFFTAPGSCFALNEISKGEFVDSQQLLVQLRLLAAINLIEEHPANSLQFQATRHPWNRRLLDQVQERFALENRRKVA